MLRPAGCRTDSSVFRSGHDVVDDRVGHADRAVRDGDAGPGRGLRKRIIYRLQEIYFGGVEPNDMSILNDIADKDPLLGYFLRQSAIRKASSGNG